MGDQKPRLGTGDGGFPVPRQPTASPEPGEGPFDHPPAWQDFESTNGVGTLDDLDPPVAFLKSQSRGICVCAPNCERDKKSKKYRISLGGLFNGIKPLGPAIDFICEVFVRRRAELFVRHHAREDFLVALHTVDEQFVKHPLQVGREIG